LINPVANFEITYCCRHECQQWNGYFGAIALVTCNFDKALCKLDADGLRAIEDSII
jgi:hypothetical protein